MPQTIVKIQLPQVGNTNKALFYNRSKSIMQMMDITPELLALFGGRKKIYVAAHINSDDQLVIDKVLSYQNW